MPDPRETLARIRKRADAATPGPWETDGTGEVSQHWSRPEPWETVVGTGVSCMSYCYGGSAKGAERVEDAKFIAAARTDVPRLVDALEKVLNLHFKAQPIPAAYGTQEGGDYCVTCAEDWPCATVAAITRALEGESHD